jgi:hypothetical protein
MRKLLVSALVLVVLAVVLDRVGVRVAQRVVAERMRSSAHLTATPTVTIDGFPFLTQALSGSYERIQVTANDLSRGGVHITTLRAEALGASVPLGDVLSGNVKEIPVTGLTGTALVTYADLARFSGLVGVTITPLADGVEVTGRLSVLGMGVRATAVSSVSLKGRYIVVTARSLRVLGQSSPAVLNALGGRLDLRVPVGSLPYGLQLTGLRATGAGVELEARTGPTVLRAG